MIGNYRRRILEAPAMIALMATMVLGGCAHMMGMMQSGVDRPAESEFGLGPRTSSNGVYRVTLEPGEPLARRRLQGVTVHVEDASGRAIEGADLTVDGGMPEHGHGLPTRPRVTARLGDGRYEVDGLRFSMGGWWEIRLGISSDAGKDTVTFNLDI